jgi:hypothetical protein
MANHKMGWACTFDEPVTLPDGRRIVTLRDAANHITSLPRAEAKLPEWQAAIEALILVADLNGPTMFARIGVMKGFEPRRGAPVQSSAQRSPLGQEEA